MHFCRTAAASVNDAFNLREATASRGDVAVTLCSNLHLIVPVLLCPLGVALLFL